MLLHITKKSIGTICKLEGVSCCFEVFQDKTFKDFHHHGCQSNGSVIINDDAILSFRNGNNGGRLEIGEDLLVLLKRTVKNISNDWGKLIREFLQISCRDNVGACCPPCILFLEKKALSGPSQQRAEGKSYPTSLASRDLVCDYSLEVTKQAFSIIMLNEHFCM